MTIAEQCKAAPDPFKEAAEHAIYKKEPSDCRVVFFFNDRSYLAFNVSYAVAEAGEGFM